MESYRFVVQTNPTPGMEDEYNEWYSNTHIQDVVELYGFTAAQRFVLEPHPRNNPEQPAHKYLAIYEIETDDLAKTFADLKAASGTPRMMISEGLGRPVYTMVMKPITPRVTRKGKK